MNGERRLKTPLSQSLRSVAGADDALASALEDTMSFVRRYVVVSHAQSVAIALWTFHTHAFEAASTTPYLSITSAEMESGKTRLLETLELVVAKPWLTGRATPAVLARKIDKEQPTLLLDESDAAFKGDREYAEVLRGVLNSGHRRSGRTSICVGQGAALSYIELSTFCPKAIAGIGRLPDTVASRSIAIRLKRKAPTETVGRFYQRDAEAIAEPIRLLLESLGPDYSPRLADARPERPRALGDRAGDSWEPLLAIADLAGGDWPDEARLAALTLSGAVEAAEGHSNGVRLLADARTIFHEEGDRSFLRNARRTPPRHRGVALGRVVRKADHGALACKASGRVRYSPADGPHRQRDDREGLQA
jgi:hypothetical protein